MNHKVLIGGLVLALSLVGLLFANLGRDPHAVTSPLVGRAAPAFRLKPVGGGPPVDLAQLRGRPVIVNFWATWCVPCFEEHPVLVQAARDLGSSVQILGIVYEDEEERVDGFLRQHGQAYPSLLDLESKTAIAYGVHGVPETYFIDGKGRIVAKKEGPLTPETLTEYLRQASASTTQGPS